MIEMKYAGKTFSKMTEEERWFTAQTLILKIHAIKGWTIPISEMMDILIDQFQKKLTESYANVTFQEVEYAFRNSGLEIKDWGKAMNLSLIDEVMIPYLEKRFEVSKMEEHIRKPVQIDEKKELTPEEKQEWIDEWKVKEVINVDIIPLMFYEFLDKQKMLNISKKQKWEYTEKAATNIKTLLHEDLSTCKTNDALIAFREFTDMEKNGFTGKIKQRIFNRAQRLILYDYLKGLI